MSSELLDPDVEDPYGTTISLCMHVSGHAQLELWTKDGSCGVSFALRPSDEGKKAASTLIAGLSAWIEQVSGLEQPGVEDDA